MIWVVFSNGLRSKEEFEILDSLKSRLEKGDPVLLEWMEESADLKEEQLLRVLWERAQQYHSLSQHPAWIDLHSRIGKRDGLDLKELLADTSGVDAVLRLENLKGQVLGRATVLGFVDRELSYIKEQREALGVEDE